jgi:hypothetical protein
LSTLNLTGLGASANSGEIELTGGTIMIGGDFDDTATVETLSTNSQGSTITDDSTFDGDGALILANTHDYSQAGTYESGDYASVAGGALFAVGSGAPSSGSGLDVLDNGIFEELLTSSGSYGQLNVQAAANLNGGELEIVLANGFNPAIASTFDIINLTPGEINGSFANIIGQAFDNGTGQFNVILDNQDGSIGLTVSAADPVAPEPSTSILCLTAIAAGLWRIRKKTGAFGKRSGPAATLQMLDLRTQLLDHAVLIHELPGSMIPDCPRPRMHHLAPQL